MNNDITRDMNNYINKISSNNHTDRKKAQKKTQTNPQNAQKEIDSEKTLEYLMGKFQVNSSLNAPETSKAVKQALETYKENPQFVSHWVEMCDSLIEKGLSMEEAIEKTDVIFQTLQSNIYN